MYSDIVNHAKDRGLNVESDTTVEPGAVRVWESLKKQGHEVQEHPKAETLDDGTKYVPGMKDPVYSILHSRNPVDATISK
jgi:hypothetical protein